MLPAKFCQKTFYLTNHINNGFFQSTLKQHMHVVGHQAEDMKTYLVSCGVFEDSFRAGMSECAVLKYWFSILCTNGDGTMLPRLFVNPTIESNLFMKLGHTIFWQAGDKPQRYDGVLHLWRGGSFHASCFGHAFLVLNLKKVLANRDKVVSCFSKENNWLCEEICCKNIQPPNLKE